MMIPWRVRERSGGSRSSSRTVTITSTTQEPSTTLSPKSSIANKIGVPTDVLAKVSDCVKAVLPNAAAYLEGKDYVNFSDVDLSELGIDSLGALALRSRLISAFGISEGDKRDGLYTGSVSALSLSEQIPGNLLLTLHSIRSISDWFAAFLSRTANDSIGRTHSPSYVCTAPAGLEQADKSAEGGDKDDSSDGNTDGAGRDAFAFALPLPEGAETVEVASCMQQGMLFHGLMDGGSGSETGSRAFVETFVWRVQQEQTQAHNQEESKGDCKKEKNKNKGTGTANGTAKLDLDLFRKAWEAVLQAHPTLRSSFDPNATPQPTTTVWAMQHLKKQLSQMSQTNQTNQTDQTLTKTQKDEIGKEDWFMVTDFTGSGGSGGGKAQGKGTWVVGECTHQLTNYISFLSGG